MAQRGADGGPAWSHRSRVRGRVQPRRRRGSHGRDQDGTARIWDVASGKQTTVLRGHDGSVFSADFSPDGECCHCGGVTAAGKTAPPGSGTRRRASRRRSFAATRARCGGRTSAPTATRWSLAGSDGTARIWDVASGEQTAVLRGHDQLRTTRPSFSPDGDSVVTAGDDGLLGCGTWRAAEPTAILRGPAGGVDVVRCLQPEASAWSRRATTRRSGSGTSPAGSRRRSCAVTPTRVCDGRLQPRRRLGGHRER